MSQHEENGIEIDGLDKVEIANTSVDEIDSENINLIFVGIDRSGSMHSYERDMVKALGDFKDALANSKEADEILVARADFSDDAVIGGYKRISEFDTAYTTGGCTALYDTIIGGASKLKEYQDFLKDEGMRVKAVFAIFSDGLNNIGNGFSVAKTAVDHMNKEEIVTAFISFGGEATQTAKDLGFRNILDVSSSASELRRAFNCLSKSVIENSKSAVSKQEDFFDV